MTSRVPALAIAVLLLGALAFLFWPKDPALAPAGAGTDPAGTAGAAALQAGLADPAAATAAAGAELARTRIATGFTDTGVRGVVLDARSGQPLAGVEVVALREIPSFEPLLNRFRGLFQDGLFTDTHRPAQILGRTTSNGDGTFEITGLDAGRVFLDGRSDGWFVRTPGTARLARGEIVGGIELRASPGGRVRGIVLGADGGPLRGASVSLRPGLNAFLGQITERKYRWLEASTDEHGRFDLPGVPTGSGYVIAASATSIALEEQFGIDVREGQVCEVTLRGHAGATVAGRVIDGQGNPVVSANVAMVYLDLSRVLFSADGRAEPIATDADGRFRMQHVASGRVAFVAAADGQAPSGIEELAVVDGGAYEDLELRLGEGVTITGRVVDDLDQPIAGAKVELRPFERPNDPQFLKMALKIRRVEVSSGPDGVFSAKGLTGERLIVQGSKPGFTTAMRFGVRLDEKDLKVTLQRGASIRGKVVLADGKPVTRFRVDTRSQPIPKPGDAAADSGAKDAAAAAGGADPAAPRGRRGRGETDGGSGPPREADGERGVQMRFGGGRDRGMREGTVQLPEGQNMMDRGMNMDGNWREIQAPDGTFTLTGIPPGRIRVRVRADGFLEPENREIDLQPGAASDELQFTLAPGQLASGTVVDGATGKPVSDAQVTAYKQRDQQQRRGGMFQMEMDPEDMDFMALSSATGRRSAVTDSQGHFKIESLENGRYRFTARHPDMAKASAKDVEVTADHPSENIEIRLDAGGGVEGNVTGQGERPLADALMVAFSLQAGTMRSGTTDPSGFYRIDGLPPGQYVVFKSRMNERADNIPLELMSNMRLKTVTVKQGRFARLDIHDEGEDGVRVHGVVREGGRPVPRALVTLLGTDKDGILGMGVRANAAGDDGRYELIGIKPGSYVAQVTRFQGRPIQTTFPIEVPADGRDFLLDISLPTSEISGRVVDTRGQPVAGMSVTLGSDDAALSGAEGLLGMIAQNGLSQARTDENGEFHMRSVAAGTYRITASNRAAGRRGGSEGGKHGETALESVVVDGSTSVTDLVLTVPMAGQITGLVVDGSGVPVQGAEIHYAETSAPRRKAQKNPLTDMLGMQARPIASGADGRFTIQGLTPGVYDLRVDTEALQAGKATDVQVLEGGQAEVTLNIVRGAVLKLRATNVDKKRIPFAQLSLLDGRGKPVVNKVSTLTVMRRLMGGNDKVEDSGFYEFGSVPPDTYTAVVAEPGKPELRITRTVRDGETVEWDVDVAAELASRAGK